MILNKEELLQINGGGVAITATLINALARGITTILNLGKTIGSAIRMGTSGKVCPV